MSSYIADTIAIGYVNDVIIATFIISLWAYVATYVAMYVYICM